VTYAWRAAERRIFLCLRKSRSGFQAIDSQDEGLIADDGRLIERLSGVMDLRAVLASDHLGLSGLERDVIIERYRLGPENGQSSTLQSISDKRGVTKTTVSNAVNRAISKLRAALGVDGPEDAEK
jgi:DNA-directed RNA polymerase sigma subunit (sigma70/sigma32)